VNINVFERPCLMIVFCNRIAAPLSSLWRCCVWISLWSLVLWRL